MPQVHKDSQTPALKQSAKGPIAIKLLFVIVNPNKADFYVDLLSTHYVNMTFICQGNGTAPTRVAEMLGLSETGKTVLIGTVRADKEKELLSLLEEKFETVKNGKGIAFTVPMKSLIGANFYQFVCEV